MVTQLQAAVIPTCLDYDPYMTFAEVVWHAQIELDLIAEGQDGTEHYTKREVRQIQKFVNDNRASLHAMKEGL
jgi:hypothetical protein